MRVFLAGATGAIGRQLVPRLGAAGHEVHGMTRYRSKQAMLDELGAVPVVADALDADQVAEAVGRARPEVIVHELTAIGALDLRHFDRDFALTNRLRTEGTDHLLGAKRPMRVPRFIGRLFAGETGVVMMTDARGASNAKAKRELAWRPAHPSWRRGFMAA
jgi:nucleoside-diphosphate-sugar epimerase